MTAEKPAAVLIVDDEDHILYSASLMLRSKGVANILTVNDSTKVLGILHDTPVAVVLLDLCMPGIPGQQLLQEIACRHPEVAVVVMTAVDDLETAVSCMKTGAYDYLVKPVEKDRLVSAVLRAQETILLKKEVSSLRQRLLSGKVEEEAAFAHIATQNSAMKDLFRYIDAVAKTDQPVLVYGETGVGKELVARAFHLASRRKGMFVAVNAAGLDDSAFADTLFGHRKGAFTGADREREGLVARAAGGTLFLDEIGDLDGKAQVKLLRLLQEREYYPLGADIPKKSSARIVVATNRDLEQEVARGTFRNDLFYRLRAHMVRVPPLRERLDDLPLLVGQFIAEAAAEVGKTAPTVPPELMTLLSTHSFPGNVRELRGIVFDAVARHTRGVLSLKVFRDAIGAGGGNGNLSTVTSPAPGKFPTLKDSEDALVAEALRQANNNQGIAASMLGITRQALNKRLNRKKS